MSTPETLTDVYNQLILPKQAELEKQAAEMIKQAEEEDAAGRIMARGFADELNKRAAGPMGEGYDPFGGGGRAGRKTPPVAPASNQPFHHQQLNPVSGAEKTAPKPAATGAAATPKPATPKPAAPKPMVASASPGVPR